MNIDPVEAIAEVIYVAGAGGHPWISASTRDQENYRANAKAVVSAILTDPSLRAALLGQERAKVMTKCTCGGNLPCPYDAPSSPVETTEPDPATQGHPEPAEAATDITGQRPGRASTYLAAITTADALDPLGWSTLSRIATAVMAVADAEHAALTAEVERLEALTDGLGYGITTSGPLGVVCNQCGQKVPDAPTEPAAQG